MDCVAVERERITTRIQPETHFKDESAQKQQPKKNINQEKKPKSSAVKGKLVNDQGIVTLENVHHQEESSESDVEMQSHAPPPPPPSVKKRAHQDLGIGFILKFISSPFLIFLFFPKIFEIEMDGQSSEEEPVMLATLN